MNDEAKLEKLENELTALEREMWAMLCTMQKQSIDAWDVQKLASARAKFLVMDAERKWLAEWVAIQRENEAQRDDEAQRIRELE